MRYKDENYKFCYAQYQLKFALRFAGQTTREPSAQLQFSLQYFAGNSYKLHIFLGKDNAGFINFYQKGRKTNRTLRPYANYMVFDNYTCKQEPTFANVHLADLSSVRYKTST